MIKALTPLKRGMAEDTSLFARFITGVKNLVSGNSNNQPAPLGKVLVTQAEANNLSPAERQQVQVVQNNATLSSSTPSGNIQTAMGGGSSGSSGSAVIDQLFTPSAQFTAEQTAKAHELEINQKVTDFQATQQNYYQGLINSGKIDLASAQTGFENSVNAFYQDLSSKEIARRDTDPYFHAEAEKLSHGVIFLKGNEVTTGGTGFNLQLPTSTIEQNLLQITKQGSELLGSKEDKVSFVSGDYAQPLTLRELGQLSINQQRPFGNTEFGQFLNFAGIQKNLPTMQDILIVDERVTGLIGLPVIAYKFGASLFQADPSTSIANLFDSIGAGIKADIIDYGNLAVTNPELFKYKLGTDIAIFYGTGLLGDTIKEGAGLIKERFITEEIPSVKFTGFESFKSPSLSVSAVQFETSQGFSGYAVGVTKAITEDLSISGVLGEAGKLSILKAERLPVNLLENPEVLVNGIPFSAVQFNFAKEIPEMRVTLEAPELTGVSSVSKDLIFQDIGVQLNKNLSIGVLKQLEKGELQSEPFLSYGYSLKKGDFTDLGGITYKGVKDYELSTYRGKIKEVPYFIETSAEKFNIPMKIFQHTPLDKTFSEGLDISKDLSKQASSSLTKAEEINLNNIANVVSALKFPASDISKGLSIKTNLPNLKLQPSEKQSQTLANVQRPINMKSLAFSDLLQEKTKLSQNNFNLANLDITEASQNKELLKSISLLKEETAQNQRFKQSNIFAQEEAQSQKYLLRQLVIPELNFRNAINLKFPMPNVNFRNALNYKLEQGQRNKGKGKKGGRTLRGEFYTPSFTAKELGITEKINLRKLNLGPLDIRGIPR